MFTFKVLEDVRNNSLDHEMFGQNYISKEELILASGVSIRLTLF